MKPQFWQALLFVPAISEKNVQSAARHKPDAVILDLEDGVALSQKPAARAALRSHQKLLADAGIDCILRVNGGLTAMMEDLSAADAALLSAVMVPKCNERRGLENAAELLGGTPLIALIETPAALPRLEMISHAPNLCALMFGVEDYAANLGVSADSEAMNLPATLIAAAAAAAQLLPIGLPGSLANFTNLAGFAAKVTRARALGFRAAAAIHPAQLPVIRAGFCPSPDDIDQARRIVAAYEQAGAGATKLDGAMIDAPVVEQARRVLELVR